MLYFYLGRTVFRSFFLRIVFFDFDLVYMFSFPPSPPAFLWGNRGGEEIMTFRDRVRRAQGFCFVYCSHVLCEGIGAGETAITFC